VDVPVITVLSMIHEGRK